MAGSDLEGKSYHPAEEIYLVAYIWIYDNNSHKESWITYRRMFLYKHQLLIEGAVTFPGAVNIVLAAFKVSFIKLMVYSEFPASPVIHLFFFLLTVL